MDYRLARTPYKTRGRKWTVLILIVVDYRLAHNYLLTSKILQLVLILIVVDYRLAQIKAKLHTTASLYSLNPYCCGL